jgi:hypothetical protein
MPWELTAAAGVNISVGSDFGGGDEWLISRVLGDSFKEHRARGSESAFIGPAENDCRAGDRDPTNPTPRSSGPAQCEVVRRNSAQSAAGRAGV